MRRQGGVKLYGPYQHRGQWRLVRRERGKADSVTAYPTEEKARAVLAEFRSLVEGKTVMQAIDAWEADFKRRKRSDALVTFSVGCIYRMTGVKTSGDALLSSISPRKAKAMYEALVSSGKYSDATHIATLKRARSWMNWCVKQGWARTNPFAEVEKVGKPRRGKKQLRSVAARSLFDRCVERGSLSDVAALCSMLLGMRSGEIVSIRGADVDEGGRLLWIEDGKTDNARRHLEVPDELAAHLKRLADKAGPKARIIPRRVDWVNERVGKLCAELELERVTAHGLRGTHTTLAVRGGTSAHMAMAALQEVARSIGHGASTVIAERHYVRPEATEAANTAAVLRVVRGGRG